METDVPYVEVNKSFHIKGEVSDSSAKDFLLKGKIFLIEEVTLVADSSEKKVIDKKILLCDVKKSIKFDDH